MLYWFVMTLGAELEAGEAVKGMALRLWALPMCKTSCGQRSEEQSVHTPRGTVRADCQKASYRGPGSTPDFSGGEGGL